MNLLRYPERKRRQADRETDAQKIRLTGRKYAYLGSADATLQLELLPRRAFNQQRRRRRRPRLGDVITPLGGRRRLHVVGHSAVNGHDVRQGLRATGGGTGQPAGGVTSVVGGAGSRHKAKPRNLGRWRRRTAVFERRHRRDAGQRRRLIRRLVI